MLELVLRLGVSLAVVLGLFWLVARTGARRLGGARSLMKVRARQSLSRTASLAVVEVGDRVLVVGVGDGGVRLLTELDPATLEATDPEPAPAATAPVAVGSLRGSVLSPQTWKQAWEAATAKVSTAAAVDGPADD